MHYYKTDINNKIHSLEKRESPVTGAIEITETEYNTLLAEIRLITSYVEQVYNNSIAINDVPSKYQETVQARVTARQEAEMSYESTSEEYEEACNILMGVE